MSNSEWHYEQARGELAARQDAAADLDLERRAVCLSLAADRAARVHPGARVPARAARHRKRSARAGNAVTRALEIAGVCMAALAWTGLIVLVAVGVGMCAGCGGAIQAQARAASVATVALEGVHRLAMEHTRSELAACTDEPCVDRVEADMAPVALAHDATRATLAGWVEALRIAVVAGEDGDVIAAMVTAASRLLAEWAALVAALAGVGVEVPPLPGFVLAAGGAQ